VLRVALAALLLLVPAALAGCGGTTLPSAPMGDGAAELVPSSTDLYVVVDGDLEGERWSQARELLTAFPRLDAFADELLAERGEELDAALGPDVAFAVVNLEYREAVALTDPDDPEALRRLIDEAGGAAAELDGGWWAAAPDKRAIQRLLSAREADGALAEREDFRELTGELPEDALARVFVRGGPVEDALADLQALPGELGRALDCIAAGREIPSAALALRPEDEGVRLDGALQRPDDWPVDADGFSNVADRAPEGPIVFAGAASLPESVERALACAAVGADGGDGIELLRTLGFGLDALLPGEVALLVYPASGGSGTPTVSLWAEIEDEDRTRAALEELAGMAAALVPGVTVDEVDVDPDQTGPALVVERDGEPVLYLGVDPGMVVASTTEQGVEGLLVLHDTSVGGDPRFRAAVERLDVGYPVGEALVYVDVAAAGGLLMPPRHARALEPLETLLLAGKADGDLVTVRGFLAFD
jgi:hypothetical protein